MEERKGYKLIYKKGIREVPDYFITEEQYFEYYQNMNDPTFENYRFGVKFQIVTTDTVSYYETALNLLRQGEKLSVLTWKDFANFIADWLLFKGWNICQATKLQNGGINIVTKKKTDCIGFMKCVWITKKYSPKRPVGVRVIRELEYLISKTGASKGIVVTTSRLTKGALKLIEENPFTMFYIDQQMLEKEFQNSKAEEMLEDLPF